MSPPVGIDAVGRKTKISAPPSRPTFDSVAGAIPVSSADGVTTGLGSLAEVEGATAVSTTAGIEGRELPSASISVVSIGGGGGSSDCAAGAELVEGRASTGTLSPVKTPNPRKPANFRSRSNCGAPDIKATRARARPGSGQSSRSAEKVRRAASAWMKAPPRSMPSRAHSASADSPASGAFHSSRAASTGSAGPNRPSGLQIPKEANRTVERWRRWGRPGSIVRERFPLYFKPGSRSLDGRARRGGGDQEARAVRSGDARAQQPQQKRRSSGKKAQLLHSRRAAYRQRLRELTQPPGARALRADDGRLERGEIGRSEHREPHRRRERNARGVARRDHERGAFRQRRGERAAREQRRGLLWVQNVWCGGVHGLTRFQSRRRFLRGRRRSVSAELPDVNPYQYLKGFARIWPIGGRRTSR